MEQVLFYEEYTKLEQLFPTNPAAFHLPSFSANMMMHFLF
jgi:hypothetical protein